MASSQKGALTPSPCPSCGVIVSGPCWICATAPVDEDDDCPQCGETRQWDGVLCGSCGFFAEARDGQSEPPTLDGATEDQATASVDEDDDCPQCGETRQWDGVLCGSCGFFAEARDGEELTEPLASASEECGPSPNSGAEYVAKPPPLDSAQGGQRPSGPPPLNRQPEENPGPPDVEIIKVHCLVCFETLEAPVILVGQIANCPNCNGEVTIRPIGDRNESRQ